VDVWALPALLDAVGLWDRRAGAGLGVGREGPGGGVVVVDLADDPDAAAPPGLGGALATLPAVVVGLTGRADEATPAATGTSPSGPSPTAETAVPGVVDVASALDVVVPDLDAAAEVVDAVHAHPLAATALVRLLRSGVFRDVDAGLVAESATYSALQAGPELARWLAGHQRRSRPPEDQPAVRLERSGDRLVLTLNRPHVRNAFDARTRDELLDGLAVAAADDSVTEVVLTGAGPSFCSGGDLDEFGTAADPASAHLLRLARSPGRAIAALADRVVAQVHGACVGAGIELPAFAGRVVATPDATFRLPEVGMGLVPGAGGTVSLPRRIGRQRTAWLALTGRPVDAATAHDWRLVDEVRAPSPPSAATRG
jgi:enoyl-CoA hydratase/carnithine racemase